MPAQKRKHRKERKDFAILLIPRLEKEGWVTNRDMEQATGMSKRSVHKHLVKLVDEGFLKAAMVNGEARYEPASPAALAQLKGIVAGLAATLATPGKFLFVLVFETTRALVSAGGLDKLYRAFHRFLAEAAADPEVEATLEIIVIRAAAHVRFDQSWFTPSGYPARPPTNVGDRPGGGAPLGEAIAGACAHAYGRFQELQKKGIALRRSMVFVITACAPADDSSEAIRWVRKCDTTDEASRTFGLYCVAVGNADRSALAKLSRRPVVHLRGLEFDKLFDWLLQIMKQAARTPADLPVNLPPVDWSDASVPGAI